MKHLVAKEHHPPLKKRAILELGGLVLLILLSYSQREVIGDALIAIRQSDLLFLLMLLATYWILLPLTSISYRLIAHHKLSLLTTTLAQLAGSGPGRIIPGGIGHMSISAVHLNKSGLNMNRAIAVTLFNNIIGVVVNIVLVIIVLLFSQTIYTQLSGAISSDTVIIMLLAVIALLTILQWLSHAGKTRKTLRKIGRAWKLLTKQLFLDSHRLLGVIGIAILITFGHVTLLLLAGDALRVYITPADALIALSAGVLVGGIVPTPGGVGAVEAGIASALVLLGYDASQATSIAVLFRIATYWQPLIPGILAYLYLRERRLL